MTEARIDDHVANLDFFFQLDDYIRAKSRKVSPGMILIEETAHKQDYVPVPVYTPKRPSNKYNLTSAQLLVLLLATIAVIVLIYKWLTRQPKQKKRQIWAPFY